MVIAGGRSSVGLPAGGPERGRGWWRWHQQNNNTINPMKHIYYWLSLGLGLTSSPLAAVVLPGPGEVYEQDFNTLAITGTDLTLLPEGWSLSEQGDNANGAYRAGTGSSSTGDTYSFGAAGDTDRALGGIRSSRLVSRFGLELSNAGATTMTGFRISYRGEQWRLGTVGRADRLDFQFSTDAISLESGFWQDCDALDLITPDMGGAVGLRDGNELFLNLAGILDGCAIAPGESLWLRWVDSDASGNDDGLAVDDFRFETVLVPEPAGSAALAAASLIGFAIARRRVPRAGTPVS